MTTTAQSDAGRLLRVAMKHPRDAFVNQTFIDAQWKVHNFLAPPDFLAACREFDALVRLLEDRGTKVDLIPPDDRTSIDSIYVRDASVATDRGSILCSMGKALRFGEPDAQDLALRSLGHVVIGRITSPGTVEGGDVTWLDSRTMAVGLGYRTNLAGISQLRRLLEGTVADIVVAQLPHWRGVNDVMHLMSLISPVGQDVAVVYSPLLPVPFRQLLLERGYTLVDVDADEFDTMGTNILTVGDGVVVALRGNPKVRTALEAIGIDVLEYEGTEISVKGCGGPTCLTRPLLRSLE